VHLSQELFEHSHVAYIKQSLFAPGDANLESADLTHEEMSSCCVAVTVKP